MKKNADREKKIYHIAYLLASFVICITLFSAYQKVLYPADFALSVYRFHLLPNALVNIAALLIMWLELTCAFCLLFIPRWRVAALWVTLFLFIVFTGGITVNLIKGTVFGCGCFSTSPLAKPMSWLSVLRNSGLILLVIMALVGHKKSV